MTYSEIANGYTAAFTVEVLEVDATPAPQYADGHWHLVWVDARNVWDWAWRPQ
jgi:hypothetical protein